MALVDPFGGPPVCIDRERPELGLIKMGSPQWAEMWRRKFTEAIDKMEVEAMEATAENSEVTHIEVAKAKRMREEVKRIFPENKKR